MKALKIIFIILIALFGIAAITRLYVVRSKSSPDHYMNKSQSAIPRIAPASPKSIQIAILPFNDFPKDRADYIFEHIRKIYSNCILLSTVGLPRDAGFITSRGRHQADSLIGWLSAKSEANQVIAGITSKDISSEKNGNPDYGIMGLGLNPGNACIVSSFRLKKLSDEQLFKVVIHELGHTQGLPHCPDKTCYMADAEGHNTTDEEVGFCPECKRYLIGKGWKL
jgi:archaemetzincin